MLAGLEPDFVDGDDVRMGEGGHGAGFLLSEHGIYLREAYLAEHGTQNGLFGKLGDGATTDRPTPVQVSGLTAGVEALGTGDAHSCAIVNGGLRCWGDASNYGMLGNGGFSASPLPVDVLGLTSGGQAMAVGNYHTCAVVNGGIRCWGLNDFGQLGNGTTVTSPVPVPVSGPVGGGP